MGWPNEATIVKRLALIGQMVKAAARSQVRSVNPVDGCVQGIGGFTTNHVICTENECPTTNHLTQEAALANQGLPMASDFSAAAESKPGLKGKKHQATLSFGARSTPKPDADDDNDFQTIQVCFKNKTSYRKAAGGKHSS